MAQLLDIKILTGILFGIGIVFVVSLSVPLVDSATPPSPPPTPAFKTFIIDSNATYPLGSGVDNVTALVYNDELYLISDGSIGFNITTYSP